MELTIYVPGLEKLAEALMLMAHKGDSYAIFQKEEEKKDGSNNMEMVPPSGEQKAQPESTRPVVPNMVTQTAPIRAQQPISPAVPTVQTSYKMDDLSVAAVSLIESGKLSMDELQQIMASFGVASLPELPETQYGAFATILRQKGANI